MMSAPAHALVAVGICLLAVAQLDRVVGITGRDIDPVEHRGELDGVPSTSLGTGAE